MPRASATQKEESAGTDVVACANPHCKRVLVKNARVVCPRCKSERTLVDLLVASLGGDEVGLANTVDTLQFNVWFKQTRAAVKQCASAFGGDEPRSIPGWAYRRLTKMRRVGFMLIYLPHRFDWAFVGRSTDHRVQRFSGVMPSAVHAKELGTALVQTQTFLDDVFLNFKIPEDEATWREVNYCLRVANGLTPSPAEAAYPKPPEWVGDVVLENYRIFEEDRGIDTAPLEERQAAFTLLGWGVD